MSRTVRYSLIVAVTFYFLFPMYWTVVASLRTEAENLRTPVSLFLPEVTLNNYRAVLSNGPFMRSIASSLVIAGAATLASLFVGSLAAYALSKLRHRFKQALLLLFLAMTTFPSISLLSGLFAMNQRVRAFDAATSWLAIPTEAVLVAIYMTFTLPLAVWLLTNLFWGVPDELVESALVDGATHLRVYANVLLPLAVPAFVSVGLLVFIAAWQEYLFALTLTTFDADLSTVPVAVTEYTRLGTPVGWVMAAVVVTTVPLAVLTVVFQRRIVVGLTTGAVKT